MLKRIFRLLGICSLLAASACSDNTEVMTVLAGSELKDLEPHLPAIKAATGVELQIRYSGTLDGAEKLLAGEQADLAWFSHGKYINLLQGPQGRVVTQEKTMLSPVVLGVKLSKARAWGWVDNKELSWREVAAKADSGELRYAMTNPASSNSGFTALVGITAALSGGADTVNIKDVDRDALRQFFKGQKLTAGSSGWLAESYIKEQDRLDGMINYESVLMQLNESGRLRDRLYLVYPKEGIITADYPLMLLNKDKRAAYERLVGFVRSPDFQRTLMTQTQRRPAIHQVKPDQQFPDRLLVELPFPSQLEIIDQILFAYLDEHRRPSHAFFVLDVSGSMDGERLRALQNAINNLTGLDTSVTGRFARFRSREKITIITFNNKVQAEQTFEINKGDAGQQSMRAIRSYVDSLRAGGGTAVFSALHAAYEKAGAAKNADPDRFYSIVLMSDGESNAGLSRPEFLDLFARLSEDQQQIRTFPILFGEANKYDMDVLAEHTRGRVFDGRKSLAQVFKKIRGYQ